MTPDHLRKLFAKMTPDELADTCEYLGIEMTRRNLLWPATYINKAAGWIRHAARPLRAARPL